MLKRHRIARQLYTLINNASEMTLHQLRSGAIEQEPDVTGFLIGAIANEINRCGKLGNIEIRNKILTSSGPGSQESIHGADIMGIINIDINDYKQRKIFLAQCKLIKISNRMKDTSELSRLISQCRVMLSYTPYSYVIFYSPYGIIVVSASDFASLSEDVNNMNIFSSFYYDGLARFFEDFYKTKRGESLHWIQFESKSIEGQYKKILRNLEYRRNYLNELSDRGNEYPQSFIPSHISYFELTEK